MLPPVVNYDPVWRLATYSANPEIIDQVYWIEQTESQCTRTYEKLVTAYILL